MGTDTAIAWTDHTFNTHWGCTRVSAGCLNCYAETFARRTGNDVWGKDGERRFFGDKHWAEPHKWDRDALANLGRPARVFCCSMADVFEDRRDLDAVRERLWALITVTPNLRWQLLTKRPENVARMVPAHWMGPPIATQAPTSFGGVGRTSTTHPCWPYNVWIGTTTEHQAAAAQRLPHLLALPAPVRFISYEPAIGPLDLSVPGWLLPMATVCRPSPGTPFHRDGSPVGPSVIAGVLRDVGRHLGWHGIDWVIVGGESGPKRRPFDPDWARAVRDQCAATGVAFFFKQDSGLHPGAPGPADLQGLKAFPAAP